VQRPSRRHILKGLGAAVALPWLESLAAGRERQAPRRMAFLYVPNGATMAQWTPAETGPAFSLPPILEPLAPVRDRLTVLSGLALDNARAKGDGPGDHARALACFLTGAHPVKTNGAGIRAGISVDQVAAARVGHLTRLPSLELGCDPGAQAGSCDSGYSCAYSSNLSWQGESLPLAKETEPAVVFDRLFGAGLDPRRDRENRSVIDFVREELALLAPRLGVTDRRKVDEYLSGVRAVEQRLARFASFGPLPVPSMARPGREKRDRQEHIRLMCDLLVLAFQNDITRVATFLVANAGSNKSYPDLDVPEGHHDLSHHGGVAEKQEKVARINRFHVEQLAYLLQRLREVSEPEGSLLDHTTVVYGSGIGDGDKHNHDDLPVLLAGGRRPGRHLRFDKTPLCNLYVTLLAQMGTPVPSFGDSTGSLPLT
jgi:hypothetical protein